MWPDILRTKLVVYDFLPPPSSAPPFHSHPHLKPPLYFSPFSILCVDNVLQETLPTSRGSFSSFLGSTGFPSLARRSKVLSQEPPMRQHMWLLTFWLWVTLLIITFGNTLVCLFVGLGRRVSNPASSILDKNSTVCYIPSPSKAL